MLHNHLSPTLADPTDSAARLRLQPQSDSDLLEIIGHLHGPRCAYARTLPAEYPLRPISGAVEVFVPDPCYWTPSLPFLYELSMEIRTCTGKIMKYSQPIGMRRWSAEGQNFRLECRRTVLRGANVDSISPELLADVRLAETAIIVRNPSAELCAEADRRGVGLIADIRAEQLHLADELARLNWSPAVLLVLLEAKQLTSQNLDNNYPPQFLLAQCLSASATKTDLAELEPQVLAVELEAGERPPAWLADCGKPVIAIRRGENDADFTAARRACDRLQAELAPQFDLAGYFV